MTALTTEYDGGANTASTDVSRTLSLYNFATGAWEVLGTDSQPNTDKTSVHQPGGDVKRFLSSTGEMRYRVQLTDAKAFDMKAASSPSPSPTSDVR